MWEKPKPKTIQIGKPVELEKGCDFKLFEPSSCWTSGKQKKDKGVKNE